MAMYFDGVDDYLWMTSPVTTLGYTFFIWGRMAEVANASRSYCSTGMSINGTDNFGMVGVFGGYSRNSVRCGSGTSFIANTTVPMTDTKWHNFAYRVTSDTLQASFIDGGNKGEQTSDAGTHSTYDYLSVGALRRTTPTNYWYGWCAHACLWNTTLTDDEIARLGAGANPQLIRPANLVFYEPLLEDEGSMTVGGAPVMDYGTYPLVNPIGPVARMYSNNRYQAAEFVEDSGGAEMKVCANGQVQVHTLDESSPHGKLYANGTYSCSGFIEQTTP